jgi:pentatricopeptide repeat protein
MIKSCIATGAVERGLSFLDEMQDLGVRPNIVTFNTLLQAAAQGPLW